MGDIKTDLYEGMFRLFKMAPQTTSDRYGPAGTVYSLDDEHGKLDYWVYFRDDLFAVNSFEMNFAKSCQVSYRHHEHLVISLFDETRGLSQYAGPVPGRGRINVYVGNEGANYHARIEKGGLIRGVSITISPNYYRDYLQARFGPLFDVREKFQLVDGRRDLPNLISLFRTIRNYRGQGISADLFYEAAVTEAVSLVLDKAYEMETEKNKANQDDEVAIAVLCSYIGDNLASDLSCKTLANKAYLGQTKLKNLFKSTTGMTPGAFVTKQRMERAAYLLTNSSKPIEQIAREVGYRSASAFSTAYRRHYGSSPIESR